MRGFKEFKTDKISGDPGRRIVLFLGVIEQFTSERCRWLEMRVDGLSALDVHPTEVLAHLETIGFLDDEYCSMPKLPITNSESKLGLSG
jgi:hypothetical protein